MTGPGTDFLSRIAAKAVGAAPLVEPRLPSRFETRPEGPAETGPAWQEPLETEVEISAAPAVPARRRPAVELAATGPGPTEAEAADPVDEARPRSPREAGRAERAAAAAQPPPLPTPRLVAVTEPAPASRRTEEAHAMADVPRPLLVPPPQAEPRKPPLSATPPPDPEPFPPPARERGRPSPPAPEAAESDRPVPNRLEEPARSSRPQAVAPDLAIRMPEVRPRPTRGEIRAAEPAPPPRPPVVNITIGRVEVRAPAAAAPPPRPARPSRPEPQSLADYLKQRGGRR
jgi:hypothetical protein